MYTGSSSAVGGSNPVLEGAFGAQLGAIPLPDAAGAASTGGGFLGHSSCWLPAEARYQVAQVQPGQYLLALYAPAATNGTMRVEELRPAAGTVALRSSKRGAPNGPPIRP